MYWRFSCVLTAGLATLSTIPSAFASAPNEEIPIGISLGVDHITSAYISKSGNFVTTASIELPQAWKDFARSLLRVEGDTRKYTRYTDSGVDELLTTALSSIREATQANLNRKVNILGMTYPVYIADSGYNSILGEVAARALPGMKDGGFAWPYLHSVRKANQLDNAEALGYPVGTNIDQEDSLLLHVDYQNSILEVSITSITTSITYLERSFRLGNFGGAKQNVSPKMLENLRTRTKSLVKAELSRSAQLSDFRRIVFSGDAPASEFKKIQETIVEAVPEFSERFSNRVEPKWAGAIGAAMLAKEIWSNPKAFDIEEQVYESSPHDEL